MSMSPPLKDKTMGSRKENVYEPIAQGQNDWESRNQTAKKGQRIMRCLSSREFRGMDLAVMLLFPNLAKVNIFFEKKFRVCKNYLYLGMI
jgi:hypothetical protein